MVMSVDELTCIVFAIMLYFTFGMVVSITTMSDEEFREREINPVVQMFWPITLLVLFTKGLEKSLFGEE